jgi:hypothetical protein
MFRIHLTMAIMAGCIAASSILVWRAEFAVATELQDQGLSFSDEKGGFRLLSVTGSGTPQDPITVTEEVTGPAAPVLVIRGLSAAFGNLTGTFHLAGFAMKKIVINRTDKTWRSYRVELREVENRTSNYEDGLSFGQSAARADSYTRSPTFTNAERVYEPEDSITFNGGVVPPGGTAILQFIITDMSPVHTFYLFQEPVQPITERRLPAAATRLVRWKPPTPH